MAYLRNNIAYDHDDVWYTFGRMVIAPEAFYSFQNFDFPGC